MTGEELAKVLDTEGCIGAAYSTRSGITSHVTVGMTDKTIPEILYQQFGGHLTLMKSRNPRAKDCWFWQVRGHKCLPVLQLAAKHLIVKRLQAMYTYLIIDTLNRPGDGRKPSETRMELRERFYVELRYLNGKGVNHGLT